jgi:hypothetical protein
MNDFYAIIAMFIIVVFVISFSIQITKLIVQIFGFIIIVYVSSIIVDLYFSEKEVVEVEYKSFTQNNIDGIVLGKEFLNLNKALEIDVEEGSVVIERITTWKYPIAPDKQSSEVFLKDANQSY